MTEHDPEETPSAVARPSVDPEHERGGVPGIVKVGVVFALLGGAVALLLFGSQASGALVYSKLVDDVLAKPGEFKNRDLRVEGDLKPGSIKFRESPCEWRFVLGKEGREMPVRFPQCIVPDTFKDGMGLKVTVEGKLHDEGYFLATKVIPRCPSKYEMQERARRGEKMPAGDPGARMNLGG